MEETFIPLSVPNLKGNELNYVTRAVETEWVSTGGPYVDEFEHAVADYVHAKGAVSCQNGTSGIHTALLVSGVTSDDVVLVPALTFIAAVNPVAYIGAEPVFMDCDDSLCMDPEKVERFCREECETADGHLIEKTSGRRVKAVVVVHVFGNMADMERLMQIAGKYGLTVIEDATEAIGTFYEEGIYAGKYAGTIGDLGVYSFNGNKIITTGGGGMIVSDNGEYVKRAKHLTTQAKSDELYYTHDEIGYNYRMTNLQAALGLAQLEQLEAFIAVKRENYERYREAVADIPGFRLMDVREGTRSNRWFYALYCGEGGPDRDTVIRYLSQHRVQSRPIWGLICDQKPYRKARRYQIEKAADYQGHVVNLPCSSNLTPEEVCRVTEMLRQLTASGAGQIPGECSRSDVAGAENGG